MCDVPVPQSSLPKPSVQPPELTCVMLVFTEEAVVLLLCSWCLPLPGNMRGCWVPSPGVAGWRAALISR